MVAYSELTFQEKVDNFFKVFEIEPLNYKYCAENIDKREPISCSECKRCDGIKIYPEIDSETLLKLISILWSCPINFTGQQIKVISVSELELYVLEKLIDNRYVKTPNGSVFKLVQALFKGETACQKS